MSERINRNDPDYSDRIRRLLDDEDITRDSSSDDEVDDSDADPDFILSGGEGSDRELSENYSDDEILLQEANEEDIDIAENNNLPGYFIERMKKTEQGPANAWQSEAPQHQVRTPARNIIRTGLPGIRGRARALGNNPSKKQVWNLFFDDDMISKIVLNTNKKLSSVKSNLSTGTNKSNYRDTCTDEINALLGLLLLKSVLKSNDEKITSLFTKDGFSRPIFSATMSEKRFVILLSCLRFDDANTRAQRKEYDKAAPITEIFEKFIENSQSVYCVSSEMTVDEMLVPFRGRCGFRVYLPNKPKKYGIKVICLTDSKTSYLLNAYIYTGKGSDGKTLSQHEQTFSVPTQATLQVCKPILGSNRNVTADNWFTSIEVMDELLKRKVTYVGTVKKDKKMIPEELLPDSQRPVSSALYGFRGPFTLVSFVPKKNRAVVLASTMHHTIEHNQEKKKPEIICFYNATKCGVDILDMKCAVFSSSRKTRRWPLAMFYRIINVASVNSFIVYNSFKDTPMINRFDYIKQLANEMIIPHLQKRLNETLNLPRGLKESIKSILGNVEPQPGPHEQREVPCDRLDKRKTCSTCPYEKKRKTGYMCIACKKAICLDSCSRKICLECSKTY